MTGASVFSRMKCSPGFQLGKMASRIPASSYMPAATAGEIEAGRSPK